ncbi:hypothetical protein AVEN_175058-1 [Araneus ventricosus]|uniref:Uncharacterized protein n=1 Tax=Araneus ventricosus TaxID=182803 RepID=A0A4Y2MPG0_ARAVE|nr:hypothetical protein AVEN_175058-1 [Araneus ventricosus]
MTRTTFKTAPPSPNFPTTSEGGPSNLDIIFILTINLYNNKREYLSVCWCSTGKTAAPKATEFGLQILSRVYVISSVPRTNQTDGNFRQAPPDYESAVYLKRLQIEEPPSYETAIANKSFSSYCLTL